MQTVSFGAYLSLAKYWLLDVPTNDVNRGSYKYYYYRHWAGTASTVKQISSYHERRLKCRTVYPGKLVSV